MTTDEHEIRDLRGGNWFWMHNVVLDKFSLTPTEFAVYACICRNASNNSQRSVVKIADIAKRFELHRSTVYRAILKLRALQLVGVERRRTEKGNAPSILILLAPLNDPPPLSHPRDKGDSRTHATTLSHPCDKGVQQSLEKQANDAEHNLLILNIQDSVCTAATPPTHTTAEQLAARALEDPAKPLTEQAVQLIGQGIANARKARVTNSDVVEAIENIRSASVRLGAAAACWKNPVVKEAVKQRLAAGDDGIVLATRFEAFIVEGRRKLGPGAWSFVNADWMVTIITNVRATSGTPVEAEPLLITAEDLALANMLPPSPVDDPVGLARWMRAVANALYGGNTGEAQNHYDRLIQQAALQEAQNV